MKVKHLLTVVLVFLSFLSNAQIEKGRVIWTAGINSENNKYKSLGIQNPNHNFGGSGDVSFFIKEGLAIGIAASGSSNYSKTTIDDSQGLDYKSNLIKASTVPFLRKYWQLKPIFVYAGGGAELNFSKFRSIQQVNFIKYDDQKDKALEISLQAQLGVIYPVTRRIGLELAAQSSLFPISFNTIKLGLVVATGVSNDDKEAVRESPLNKGRWLLSGSFRSKIDKGYFTSSNGVSVYRSPSTFVELSPGLFVQDRLMIGLGLFAGFQEGVLYSLNQTGFAGDKNPFLIGLRPFVKKYFSQTKLTPYAEGHVSYDRIMAGGRPTNSYFGGGTFGLAYVIGKNWLVEARLLSLSGGYSEIKTNVVDVPNGIGANRFSLDLDAGFKPDFVVSYVFR